MKVALIGASGHGGSRLLAELAAAATGDGIARHPERSPRRPASRRKRATSTTSRMLSPQLLKGHDAVISAVHFTASDPKLLIEAVQASGVKRYFVVGGAGSLEVAPGVTLIGTPEFPAATRQRRQKAANSSSFCERRRSSTGPSCRPPRCLCPASARASFGSARISF